ncbi:MAG: nucleoside/nucleotide kinase family protein [Jatrophihabitantaceae bacterium]
MVAVVGIVDDLAALVGALPARSQRRVMIGIAGAPGSGKTTLAELLAARLGGFPRVAHVPMDGFHLADVELERLGRAARKGAPDTFDPLGYAAVLARIAAGEAVWAPGFERVLEQPIAQAVPVLEETRIVLSEGNYLLVDDAGWRAVREQFDEVWFCVADDGVRVRRLIARHVQFGKSPDEARAWVMRSDERNAALVATTESAADLVIDLAAAEPTDHVDGR